MSLPGVRRQTKHDSLFLCKHRRCSLRGAPAHLPLGCGGFEKSKKASIQRQLRALNTWEQSEKRQARGFPWCGGEPRKPGDANREVFMRSSEWPSAIQMMWGWGHPRGPRLCLPPLLQLRIAHHFPFPLRPCGRIKNEVFVQSTCAYSA